MSGAKREVWDYIGANLEGGEEGAAVASDGVATGVSETATHEHITTEILQGAS